MHYNAVKFDFYNRRMNELVKKYPDLFNKKFPVPLAIGIHKKLEKETDFTKQEISALLWVWVRRFEYVMMCLSMGSRVDLDGSMSLMDEASHKMYIEVYKKFTINGRRKKIVKRFCRGHLEKFGRPALLGLPIRDRSF